MTTSGASKAYDSLFGSFGLRENPFHVSPDARFLFSGPAYQTAIAELMFGVQSRRGLHVLTGEAGTGKTTLMRYFLQWLADRHYSTSYVFHTHLAPSELFELVLRDFGVPVDSSKKTALLAALHKWLLARQSAGDTPVLIVDEAQALSIRTLSELRLLLNLENTAGKLLQIVLAGQPELVEKLHRPELSALRQRMMVHCRLPVLTLEDTAEYINARLRGAGSADPKIFSPETVQTLYSFARGIPRITNLLCERAMIGAYAEQQTVVSPEDVRKVAAEYDLEGEAGATALIDFAMPRGERGPSAIAKIAPLVKPKPVVESQLTLARTPEIKPATAEPSVYHSPISAVSASPASDLAMPRSEQGPSAITKIAPLAKPKPVVESRHTLARTPEIKPAAAEPSVSHSPVPALSASPESAPAVSLTLKPAPSPQPPKPKETHAKEFIVEFCLDSAQQQESPKIVDGFDWRKYRPDTSFKGYWTEISKSFRKDARELYSSVAPALKSLARNIRLPQAQVDRFYHSTAPRVASFTRNLRLPKADGPRKLFATMANWLRTPINKNEPRVSNSAARHTRAGKP